MNNNEQGIIGTIKKIVFISPKGFGIFTIDVDNEFKNEVPLKAYPKKGEKEVKVVGFIGKDFEIIEGYKISIKGKFENRDEKYVTQHNKDFSPELEFKIKGDIDLVGGLESLSGLKAYLVRYMPGIGEKQADVLIKTIGLDNVIKKLDEKDAINTLLNVKGIGQLKAEGIKEEWDNGKLERNILIELGGLGLSINKCGLVYKTWGAKYKEYLDKDPYKLTEIKGIGFAMADEVAMNALGIGKKDERRYAGIIEFVIREYASNNGDTIISIDNIKEGIKKFIASDPEFNTSDISIISETGIEKALEKNTLFRINSKTYALGYYAFIEGSIAKKIKEGKSKEVELTKTIIDYIETIKKTTTSTPEQLQAIKYSFSKGLSIILGGAGTGKTFTVGNIINGLIKNNIGYYIVAPTNKAAGRVKEINPNAAVTTIHSLLQIKPGEEPLYNEENPLPYDKLIIDEGSMIDNKIAFALLNAIDFTKTSVIFVGDYKQLPPVDAGSFFFDIINSGFLDENITYLTEVKRTNNDAYERVKQQGHKINILQEGIHNIVANSLKILKGEMPIHTGFDSLNIFSNFNDYDLLKKIKDGDTQLLEEKFNLVNTSNIDIKKLNVKELGELDVMNKLTSTYNTLSQKGIDVNKDFQLYIPTYKGNLGIPKVNQLISDLVNKSPVEKLDRGQEFKVNDKIIYTETNKELGLTKGDIGIIKEIYPIENKILVDFYSQGIIEIKNSELDNIELGYAISVHKAQGTEVKYGAILLLKGFYMLLNNQLLYTAYTRCKDKVFLFGEEDAYKTALKNHINQRNTLLFHLLAGTPTDEIYPSVSRKDFSISLSELKHVKETLSKKLNKDNDNMKIIKVKYSDSNPYQYYRYLYGDKDLLSNLDLYTDIELNEGDIDKLEKNEIYFLRIKKYTNKNEKRGFFKKVVNNDNAFGIEINSDDKEINII